MIIIKPNADPIETKMLLLTNVTISEERWDAERQRMVYRIEYNEAVDADE